MSKLKPFLLIFTLLTFALSFFLQRHALACEFIEYLNYSEIAPQVFVSQSFNIDKKEQLLSTINKGKTRISNTFGKVASTPKIVILSNSSEAANLGSNEYGRAFGTPLGECLVIGNKGQNVDVIAHEYMHAEVHYRVGWFNHLLKVPTWFNEGLATLVDFRKAYLLENINLTLTEVNVVRKKTFNFELNHYQASRVLVNNIDKTKLYKNLEKIKQGQSISNIFSL